MSYPHLLALRAALYNGAALALLGLALGMGWVDQALAAAPVPILLVACVFGFGLGLFAVRLVGFGVALEELKATGACNLFPHQWLVDTDKRGALVSQALRLDNLKLKLSSRIAPISEIASSLVMLGLLGTVVGFIMALSGLDPEKAADIGQMPGMAAEMVHGMHTALYATLTGGVLNLWLKVNVGLLKGAAARIVSAAMAGGDVR